MTLPNTSKHKEIAAFEQEVKDNIAQLSADKTLKKLSNEWIIKSGAHKYTYNFRWLGRPIIQFPQDVMATQELIWSVKPDVVIETGIAHGGSATLSASILAMLDYADAVENGTMLDPKNPKRKVVAVDIDIREHNLEALQAHPMYSRMELIEGSAIDPSVVEQVKAHVKPGDTVLVFLDSNHTHEHVLEELKAYAPLVSTGSYCVVFDTAIEDVPADFFDNRPWGPGDNPKTAVWEYLKTHKEFEIDHTIEDKLLITVAPDGFLKRTS